MDPIIVPSKSADIGMRQLRNLANMPPAQRWQVVSEGLAILLKSAEGLYAASREAKDVPRAREILEGHASEEAAKILILLDYVRCPLGMSDHAQRLLRSFYDHGTRLLYAEACRWRPSDLEMLREYVDRARRSHYLEGDLGEYILPNSQLYDREARLYADLVRHQDGSFLWNDPEAMFALSDNWHLSPPVIDVSRALSKVGAFTADGLAIIHKVWSAAPFVGPEHAQDSDELIRHTLNALIEASLVVGGATDKDGNAIYSYWQMPMYAIETKTSEVALEELREAQERNLYAQM